MSREHGLNATVLQQRTHATEIPHFWAVLREFVLSADLRGVFERAVPPVLKCGQWDDNYRTNFEANYRFGLQNKD